MIITQSFDSLSEAIIQAAELSTYSIAFIRGKERGINETKPFLRIFLKFFILIGSHIDLAKDIRCNREKDAIIVYGFSTEFLWLTYIFSLFKTQNVYLINHHNVQQAYNNLVVRLLFCFYHWVNYKIIINETLEPLKVLCFSHDGINRHLSIPLPVYPIDIQPSPLMSRVDGLKVGIIGKVRKGKNFHKTLSYLLGAANRLNFTLVVGTDNISALEGLQEDQRVKLFNTSKREDYLAVLSLCDVVVLNYERDRYFYRCSQIAAESIGVRSLVVCPDFPLMACQINFPVKVGVLYPQESELESALAEALKLVSSLDSEVFQRYYAERSPAKIAAILDQAIGNQQVRWLTDKLHE